MLKPAKATIMTLEVMISHNSQMDSARKSVKTSSDLEDSNRSDEFKKRYLYIWNVWEKRKNVIFHKCFFKEF